ncbi:MAG: efflux RND transporter periplasmic adaptor subunit [bacterium]|nr:efflux RND transporter periplasmic adaptor subunit [bacterium]
MTVHSARYLRRRMGCTLIALLLVFGSAFAAALAKYIGQRRAPAPVLPAPPPPPVYVVAPTNLTILRSSHADLQADKVITLSANVEGEILSLYVDVGSSVTQGQVLLVLDPRYKRIALQEAEAAYDQALVTYSNALIDWRNYAHLLTNAVIGDESYRRARLSFLVADAACRTAAAALSRAREHLRDCVITAPCDGSISIRRVERNERVVPQQPLLTLVHDARLRLIFFVDDRDVVHLHTNTPVSFSVDALPGSEFVAFISAIGPDVEPATRLYRVEATYDNRDHMLKPGMVARVHVPVRRLTDVLCVPSYALKFDEQGVHVLCLQHNQPVRVPVRTGESYESWVEILYGLAPGDHVLLR